MYIDYGESKTRSNKVRAALADVHYDYNYPNGLDLSPGSELHDLIRDKVREGFRESHSKMQGEYPKYEKVEWTKKAYVPLDKEEQRVKAKDPRKPVSVVMPVSAATCETLLTYCAAAFWGEAPMIPFEARSPEDIIPVAMLELLVDFQRMRKKWELSLHTQWSDGFTYGRGALAPVWTRDIGYRTVRGAAPVLDPVTGMTALEPTKTLEEYVSFEGHELHPIDPWLYFPDPNAPAHLPEKMEYCGWVTSTNTMALLNEEKSTGSIFNALYLKHTGDNRTMFLRSGDREPYEARSVSSPADALWQYRWIIPQDWKLGASEYPELWLFALAGDEIVIHAKRCQYGHNRIPVVVCAPDTDGRAVLPVSRLEIGYGLQETVNWLISSHTRFLRKQANGSIIYNPEFINSAALQAAGEAGGLIPTRRMNWGGSIKDHIMPFPTSDVTRGNIPDANFLMDHMNKVLGTTDGVQGVIANNTPERQSAAAAKGIRSSAMSRLEHTARMISIQSMRDLGMIVGSQTQQLMSENVAGQILGRTAERLKMSRGGYLEVSPFDVLCDFDVVPRDGSIPNPDNADTTLRMLEIIMRSPVAANYNIGGMIQQVARQSGMKDLEGFQIETQVMDDQQVQQQVEAGNMVPVGTEL